MWFGSSVPSASPPSSVSGSSGSVVVLGSASGMKMATFVPLSGPAPSGS
jgi:hypothetical protein